MATKVTEENVKILPNNIAICPLSRNKYSEETHFTIDADRLHLIVGRSWSVLNDSSHRGAVHLVIRSHNPATRKMELLHRVLFRDELSSDLTVDHLLHWTDNRRVSVDFLSIEENVSRGKAIYNRSRSKKGKR